MDFSDSVISAARSWVCGNIDTAQRRADYFGRATVSSNGVGIPIAAISTEINNFGRYLYGCPASAGPYVPAPSSITFSGGQCPAPYNGTISWSDPVFGPNQTEPWSLSGPGVRPQVTGQEIGEITTIRVVNDAGQSSPVFRSYAITANRPPITLDGFTLMTSDGSPDDCGDGPFGPGAPPATNQPITYDGPDGNPVTENVDITLENPIVLPNGNTVIPVCVGTSEWEVCVNIPTDGTEPTAGPRGANPGAEGCCPQPAPVDPPANGDEDPPEEDPNGPILGVIVTTTSPTPAPDTTEKGLGDGPTLNIPRLGTVHFGISAGGVSAWMNVIDIKNKRCFVPVPGGLTAIAAKVNSVKGVTFDTKVVYQRQPEGDT